MPIDRSPSRAAIRRKWLAIGAVAALAVSFGGVTAAQALEPSITGEVDSAATGKPLEGVRVCASPAVNLEYPVSEQDEWCATTDASGRYSIDGLAHNEFRIEFSDASADELTQFHGSATASYPTREEYLESTPVKFEGATVAGIDATMREGGRITGRVSNRATGDPIEGVSACVELPGYGERKQCAKTDAEGEYTLAGLYEGSTGVHFDPGELNYLPETPQRTYSFEAHVLPESTVEGADAKLEEGGEIEGQVSAAVDSMPIAGERVCAIGDGPSLSTRCVTSGSGGSYGVPGLEASAYYVTFATDRPYLAQYYDDAASRATAKTVKVALGSVTSEVNASLATGATIEGDVVSASTGEPMGGVEACVDEGESRWCRQTEADGHYALTGIATGAVVVEFLPKSDAYEYRDQYYDGVEVYEQATRVSVTAGETITGIDAALRAHFGVITGKVSDAQTKQPIGRIAVCATDLASKRSTCVQTDANGEFEITRVVAGAYRVLFASTNLTGREYEPQFYQDAISVEGVKPVIVQVGVTTPAIDAELTSVEAEAQGRGDIRGTVTSAATSKPIKGIEVCAFSEFEEECALTGATGEYELSSLPDGSYAVEFASPMLGGLDYATQYYDGSEMVGGASLVQVRDDAVSADVDASLRHGAEIEGVVSSAADGAGIDEALVCAVGTAEEPPRCAVSGPSGSYDIRGLDGGSYYVGFDAGEAFVIQYYDRVDTASQAQAVTVSSGGRLTGIDAVLMPVLAPAPPELVPAPPVVPPGRTSDGPTDTSPPAFESGRSENRSSKIVDKAREALLGPIGVILGHRLRTSPKGLKLRLHCRRAACKGSVRAFATRPRGGRHSRARTRRLALLARTSFSLAAKESGVVTLRLTRAGRRVLASARRRSTAVWIELSIAGGKRRSKRLRVPLRRSLVDRGHR